MPNSSSSDTSPEARLLIESRMGDALHGDAGACFDLGTALACGKRTRDNMVEAFKWFTLAAQAGYAPAAKSSAMVARDMSASELAEARRRTWIAGHSDAGRQVARFSSAMFA